MFRWLQTKSHVADDQVALQPPNKVFPWAKGMALAAVDEVVIAVPTALFEEGRPMSEFRFGPDDMEISADPARAVCFIKLQPGMSARLAKSCQAYVVAQNEQPRRIKVSHNVHPA